MSLSLQSPLLLTPTVKHGFFTRNGGQSSGIYAALNCGLGSDDAPADVRNNRQMALSSLAGTDAKLCGLYQIHSNIVHDLEIPWDEHRLPQGDAVVTSQKNIALAILTADCAPVLFSDPVNGVIGAAHAGWKGALAGVLENTINMMCQKGAERCHISAAIGPCIAQTNYEVGPDFYKNIMEKSQNYQIFFKDSINEDHYLFDLKNFILHRLNNAHIQNTSLLPHDTYDNKDDFFSYRRTTHLGEKDYGRQISLIMLI